MIILYLYETFRPEGFMYPTVENDLEQSIDKAFVELSIHAIEDESGYEKETWFVLANSYCLYNVPWGLYKALMYVKEHYGNPSIILSENGIDNLGYVTLAQGLHDTTRINYYKDYLTQLKKAVDDGANVVGYFAWSLLDNFEWRSRFGIVYVDFSNPKSYPKMSAYWFKQLLTQKEQ
ncbi:beta-glucosidase 44-like [Durio zibethinus]|uniref:Beta-glucosidase 44-like n=1 Tax=Durio zibethinus TaxID=66656 RepID=A0A6P5WIG7_DURZI|nr:beta-glucosidase 44-like [Durio zibethinus]